MASQWGPGSEDLTWKKLSQFNAVVLFGMSRLFEGTRDVNAIEISPEGFRRISDLLSAMSMRAEDCMCTECRTLTWDRSGPPIP